MLLSTKNIVNKSVTEKRKIAEKLHKQFSHPSYEKLSALLRDANVQDVELLEQLA